MNRNRSSAKRALKRAVSALLLTLGPGRTTFADSLGWGWVEPSDPNSLPIAAWGYLLPYEGNPSQPRFVPQNPTATDDCFIEGGFVNSQTQTIFPIPTIVGTFTAGTLNFSAGPVTFAAAGNIIGDVSLYTSGVSQTSGSLLTVA